MNRIAMVVGLVSASLWSCQSYDFERVQPLAASRKIDTQIVASRRLIANEVLLIDNSGSMSTPIEAGGPTRIEALKSGMAGFLAADTTLARFGLAVFPTTTGAQSCGAPETLDVALDANDAADDRNAMIARASEVNARVQSLIPNGGTPTAAALRSLLNVSQLTEKSFRDNIVILVTDGLPNCNEVNPNQVCGCSGSCSTQQTAACACTGSTCMGTTCSLGCLDQDATVMAIGELLKKGIRTAVVGFGSDVAGADASIVLEAMARAGGLPRESADGRSFYRAASSQELIDALSAIVPPPYDCHMTLSEMPSDANLLEVKVNGTLLTHDAWTYESGTNAVVFQGATCAQLKATTNVNPVTVEVAVAQRF